MFQECGLALSSLQLRLWQPLPDSAFGLSEDSWRESRTRGMSAMTETEGWQASAPAFPGREEDTDTCWVQELAGPQRTLCLEGDACPGDRRGLRGSAGQSLRGCQPL